MGISPGRGLFTNVFVVVKRRTAGGAGRDGGREGGRDNGELETISH